MTVSVIIPVYNRAQVVPRTLASVLRQTHRPLEVVLVDNCSTDDTLQVLNRFKDSHNAPDFSVVVTQEERHTASAARNKGFKVSTGEWVLFFDSDDEMAPYLVEKYVEKIEQHHGELEMIATRAILQRADGSKVRLAFCKTDMIANNILHSLLATQRYIVRRVFFAKAGMWNVDVLGWDDWELGLRLLLGKPRIEFIPNTLVYINDSGEASITGTEFSSRHGKWEKVIDLMQREIAASSIEDKDRYFQLLDFKRIVLAASYEMEGHSELAKPLYQEAYGRLKRQFLPRLAMPMLYRYIKSGNRGASRLARYLLRGYAKHESSPYAIGDRSGNQLLVSIIIPVYNRAGIVQRTLNSVWRQSYRPLHVVTVDNGSTDGSLQVLNEFKEKYSSDDFQVEVTQEKHLSASSARNKGLSIALGDWLVFFDSDDEMSPSLVQEYVNKINEHKGNVDLVATRGKLIKKNGGHRRLAFFKTDIMGNHIIHSILATQRYIVNRNFVKAAGFWNEDLPRWNDWEMGMRMLMRNPRMEFVNQTLVYIHDSGKDSITGNGFSDKHGQWENVLDLVAQEIEQSALRDKQRYLHLVDYRRIVLAAHYVKEGHPELGRELYQKAYGNLKKQKILRYAIPVLFYYTQHGIRGAGHVARFLIK